LDHHSGYLIADDCQVDPEGFPWEKLHIVLCYIRDPIEALFIKVFIIDPQLQQKGSAEHRFFQIASAVAVLS
jgi:hypothetical protein